MLTTRPHHVIPCIDSEALHEDYRIKTGLAMLPLVVRNEGAYCQLSKDVTAIYGGVCIYVYICICRYGYGYGS